MFGHSTLFLIFTQLFYHSLAVPASNLANEVFPRDLTAPTNPTSHNTIRAEALPRCGAAAYPDDRRLVSDRYHCELTENSPSVAHIEGVVEKLRLRLDCTTGPGCQPLAINRTAVIGFCGGYGGDCGSVARVVEMFLKVCRSADNKTSGGWYELDGEGRNLTISNSGIR